MSPPFLFWDHFFRGRVTNQCGGNRKFETRQVVTLIRRNQRGSRKQHSNKVLTTM